MIGQACFTGEVEDSAVPHGAFAVFPDRVVVVVLTCEDRQKLCRIVSL